MELLTREAFETLAKESGEYCVTLYLPGHRTGREVQQDPRRFEDMLKKAQPELEGKGMRRTEAELLRMRALTRMKVQIVHIVRKWGRGLKPSGTKTYGSVKMRRAGF